MKRTVRKWVTSLMLSIGILTSQAQTLSLDSLRAMALRNNKELAVNRMKQEVARNNRRIARTNYLPKVQVAGGYLYSSREVSLLNDEQKAALGGLGTTVAGTLNENLSGAMTQMVQSGLISMQQAQVIGQIVAQAAPAFQQTLNHVGQNLSEAFRTDTRHMWGGSVMLTQPLFMGGKIIAYNKITDAAERLAQNATDAEIQNTIYATDQAYWLVVSLRHKQQLAETFCELVRKLDADVQKMIQEGVATRADGLNVSVKVNEAEMALLQVTDGLTLARMALCQLCGLPIDADISLADEDREDLEAEEMSLLATDESIALQNRPELKMLNEAVEMNRQNINVTRAEHLPSLALTGGYLVSNPNLYNGFQKKLSGMWNVGIVLKMPVWDWLEGLYKVRTARINTQMARYQLEDAKEKIRLQVNQSTFLANEAHERLNMARKNIEYAEENLRTANVGFKEGVIATSDLLTAQTAWMQARSQKIDAEINLHLTQANLRKTLGTLTIKN